MRLLFYIVFLLIASEARTQSAVPTTMSSAGLPPDYMAKSVRDKLNSMLLGTSPYRGRNERLHEVNFYVSSNYWVNDLLTSGHVLYGESTHMYLSALLEQILDKNNLGELKNKLFIHAVKSSAVNAYACDEGLIFINVGLLNTVRSESELAFVICHELAHFVMKHNLEGHLHEYKLENSRSEKNNSYDKVLKVHSYSRKMEKQADSLGFIYFSNTGFDLKSAVLVFDLLNSDELTLLNQDELNSLMNFSDSTLTITRRDSLLHIVLNDSLLNEQQKTHPDPVNRQKWIQSRIDQMTNPGERYVVSETDFNSVKQLVGLELGRELLLEESYCDAFQIALFNYKNNRGSPEHSCAQLVKSLIGLLKMKVHGRNKKTDKNKGLGFLDLKLDTSSVYLDICLYYLNHKTTQLADEVSALLASFLKNFPESEELKALNNWFVAWLQKQVKPGYPNYVIQSATIDMDIFRATSRKKILFDPLYLVFDLRRIYDVDYIKSEKGGRKIHTKLEKLNRKKELYDIKSLSDSAAITQFLNEKDIVNSRISEIDFYKDSLTSFPTDYHEVKQYCSKYGNEVVTEAWAFLALQKRPFSKGQLLLYYSIILSPIGIYMAVSPIRYSHGESRDIYLLRGKITRNIAWENRGKVNQRFLRNLLFE
ncbi:MAG: M48 family metallopeptidase [Flavobacteriales bacterium]